MSNPEKWNELKGMLDEIRAFAQCARRVSFDMECCAPPEGVARAGQDGAILGRHIHHLSQDERYCALICELHADGEGLTDVQKRTVQVLYEEYAKTKNLSEDFAYEISLATNRAYSDWLEAKRQKDFSLFRDALQTQIGNSRKAVGLRDEKKETVYDTLLDDYEKGGSIAQLDDFFGKLKTRILPLLQRVQASDKQIREDFLTREVPIPAQEELSRYLLKLEGLRETATVLMTTEHPFTVQFGPQDVRVTTHYYNDRFLSNIYSTLHEGGHAMLMQYEPAEFYEEHADDNMSNGMHECISRFYENIIGRSEAFIGFLMPKFREITGDIFRDVTEREMYEAVNIVRREPIRTEADELSYCVHIMIRYELEKAFVNGEIAIDDIPAIWNAKYRDYLGIEVADDAQGCLQDVHWTMRNCGYFPSYALGNAYGAQILRTMEKDFDVYGAVAEGDFEKIGDWLKTRVFSIASMCTPDEWIRKITGEPLNVDYYLDYLEEKFKSLYQL